MRIRWSGLVALRLGVGGSGNLERRVSDNTERSRSCQQWSRQRPEPRLNLRLCRRMEILLAV
jgi:hypothetical protein